MLHGQASPAGQRTLMPSMGSIALSAHSGTPSGVNTGFSPLGQQRLTKWGLGRPTYAHSGSRQTRLESASGTGESWARQGSRHLPACHSYTLHFSPCSHIDLDPVCQGALGKQSESRCVEQ